MEHPEFIARFAEAKGLDMKLVRTEGNETFGYLVNTLSLDEFTKWVMLAPMREEQAVCREGYWGLGVRIDGKEVLVTLGIRIDEHEGQSAEFSKLVARLS